MKKLKVGDKAQIVKTFTPEEVISFAILSGDTNPIHTDSNYASKTYFGQTIVQGTLVASLFGGLFGSELPGKGTIYLGQELKFIKPNFVGKAVRVVIELIEVREEKAICIFTTRCYNEQNEMTIDGKATMMYKGKVFVK